MIFENWSELQERRLRWAIIGSSAHEEDSVQVMARSYLVGSSQVLLHVPDLVFSGSKPAREISKSSKIFDEIGRSLRSLEQASGYLPNRIFTGAADPRPLTDPGMPWWNAPQGDRHIGSDGLLFSQAESLYSMQAVDSGNLLSLADEPAIDEGILSGEIVQSLTVTKGGNQRNSETIPIPSRDGSLGSVSWGYPGDEALSPAVIIENLAAKASAALALRHVLMQSNYDPQRLDFVISCSEEAVGDRYQRGGGNLGKAIAEAVGAERSSGFDVKNFCAAPIPGLVVASSLIEAGIANSIAVVGGGSLAKLGMKFQGHLKNNMPILEDCLGAFAVILSNEGNGPILRHDAVGWHRVGTGGSNPQIFEDLVVRPLEQIGMSAMDIGLFGTELHNPEITEPQGSGNVPLRNYRLIAALVAQRKHISSDDIIPFLAQKCVAGFAPTQGHIASAICLLPLVLRRMALGELSRAQLVAKGSLFLGRMSTMSDGMSIIIES